MQPPPSEKQNELLKKLLSVPEPTGHGVRVVVGTNDYAAGHWDIPSPSRERTAIALAQWPGCVFTLQGARRSAAERIVKRAIQFGLEGEIVLMAKTFSAQTT